MNRWTSKEYAEHMAGKGKEPGKARKPPRHLESALQQHCVTWFRAAHPALACRLWAVPNGGHRSKTTAAAMKREGQLPGVCDLMLTIPRGKWAGAMIELKAGNNTTSEAQDAFIEAHRQDYYCCVIRTLDDFRQAVTQYLNTPSTIQ